MDPLERRHHARDRVFGFIEKRPQRSVLGLDLLEYRTFVDAGQLPVVHDDPAIDQHGAN
jgi:hypothetical protein